MDEIKMVNSGDLKAGMQLLEKDGTRKEVIQVVFRSDCVEILWQNGLALGSSKLSLVKRFPVVVQ